MHILIKFTLKNMKEKKFRLALILISIILSTALFFASVSIGGNIERLFSAQMRALVGDSEIRISANEDRLSDFFYEQIFEKYETQSDYIVGGFFGNGIYETEAKEAINVNIVGYDLEDFELFNPITYVGETLAEPYSGRHIVMGFAESEKYGYELGDTIELEVLGNRYGFVVWGIANPSGLFMTTGDQINMVIPKVTASRLAGEPGKINMLLMKAHEGTSFDLMDQIKEEMKGFEVEESLSLEDIKQNTAQISSLFNLMLILVIFISIFIIYTSFKVIMMERIPVIGTFRSVGATKRSTDIILLGESLFYGIIGGVIGTVIGIGILFAMTKVLAYNPYTGTSTDVSISFNVAALVGSVLFAVILSIISSAIPIRQVSKIPVKDIVLGHMNSPVRKKSYKEYTGVALLVISILIPVLGFTKGNMSLSMVCMIFSIVGLVLVVPLLIKLFIRIFGGLFGKIFGSAGGLAIKNIKDNKNVVNNIVLLTIGIASLFMINVISYSIGIEVVDVYSSGKFDVWSWVGEVNEQNIGRVRSVEGVEASIGIYEIWDVDIVDREGSIGEIVGIDPYKYFDYWDYDVIGDRDALINTLDSGRHMILNKSLADKFDYEVGDIISIELNNRQRDYKITGFVVTLMNNGQMALISDKYFKADMNPTYYDTIYSKVNGDPEEVNDAIVKKFNKTGVWSRTLDSLEVSNTEGNNQIIVLLQGFSMLTMVIGVFGVFNNYLVNMLSRKRPLAMYRSVGMSMKQMRKMLYLESLSGGLIGGLSGMIGGLLFILMVTYVMLALNLPIGIHINNMIYIQSIAGGIIVSVVASISPVIKSSKMPIIEAIKYE